MDHEIFILVQGLATEEVVEKIPCGPSNKEVYALVDWGLSIGHMWTHHSETQVRLILVE
jgi:hypothetical protein